jgi:phosphate ABC transporter phosphate-binding protein
MKLRASRSSIRNVRVAIAWCVIVASAFLGHLEARTVKRIYVEPFATKAGAEELQKDVTAELRKLGSISVVSDESSADAILGGGGEIWINGYRSFSPRSRMKLPTNGTPIYGGFLSVELKNKSGVTLWSYLVTPGNDSEDTSKDLSKRIAKHLADALDEPVPSSLTEPLPQAMTILKGAGATFPFPVYSKWFENYRRVNPGVQITYDAVGSEAGIRQLVSGNVDFSGSDSPEAVHEIAPAEETKYLFFPSVVGAVVPIVNLPGMPSDISLTPEALAGIFLGRIKKWNDPVIARSNRNLRLPDLDITVVHRSDGSGTSYALTDYLSKISSEWSSQVGRSLAPKWPVGKSAAGNDGVAKLVKELGGSIGYVEFIYALENHLGYAKVRNRNGEFVEASLESIASAVNHTPEMPDDFKVSIVDAPGVDAYPISSFTWLVIPEHIADEAKRGAITVFLRWMLGPGQRQAAALGYLPLPKEMVAKELDATARIH